MKNNISFYGNIFRCPAGKRLPDCPVRAVEHLTFEEKVNWFDNLDPDERNDIIVHHNRCIEGR